MGNRGSFLEQRGSQLDGQEESVEEDDHGAVSKILVGDDKTLQVVVKIHPHKHLVKDYDDAALLNQIYYNK